MIREKTHIMDAPYFAAWCLRFVLCGNNPVSPVIALVIFHAGRGGSGDDPYAKQRGNRV